MLYNLTKKKLQFEEEVTTTQEKVCLRESLFIVWAPSQTQAHEEMIKEGGAIVAPVVSLIL
jgi:hypothetical protein